MKTLDDIVAKIQKLLDRIPQHVKEAYDLGKVDLSNDLDKKYKKEDSDGTNS